MPVLQELTSYDEAQQWLPPNDKKLLAEFWNKYKGTDYQCVGDCGSMYFTAQFDGARRWRRAGWLIRTITAVTVGASCRTVKLALRLPLHRKLLLLRFQRQRPAACSMRIDSFHAAVPAALMLPRGRQHKAGVVSQSLRKSCAMGMVPPHTALGAEALAAAASMLLSRAHRMRTRAAAAVPRGRRHAVQLSRLRRGATQRHAEHSTLLYTSPLRRHTLRCWCSYAGRCIFAQPVSVMRTARLAVRSGGQSSLTGARMHSGTRLALSVRLAGVSASAVWLALDGC